MTDADIAAFLLATRRGEPPSRIEVADEAQAYEVPRLVMAELGEIGGWKVGAPGPAAAPSCAPLPANTLFPAPHAFDTALYPQREVESEIGFTFGRDLPPRSTPYEPADIFAAIATCQPGIEILQSRLRDPDTAGPLPLLADFIQTGAYVWGEPIASWQEVDFTAMRIEQTIEGGPTKEGVGNPAGDMIRLMVWLANEGAVWAGGIKAGQLVTCGSWTGKTKVPAQTQVVAAFSGAAPVRISFA
jgi:2-keto-4-pentenoate hydratase